MNDASGWTLLPGKDGSQSWAFLCYNVVVLFISSAVPGTAPGECLWHNRQCPDPVMSLCVNGAAAAKRRKLLQLYFQR